MSYAEIISINVLCGKDYILRDAYKSLLNSNYQDLLGYVHPTMDNEIEEGQNVRSKVITSKEYFGDPINTGPWRIQGNDLIVPFGNAEISGDWMNDSRITCNTIMTASRYLPVSSFKYITLDIGIVSPDDIIHFTGPSEYSEYVEMILEIIRTYRK